ncbi:MAG TPA: Uma2 family endonuclease [Chloroflexia bacterium]|nr:Uma2 family endonuclease [Chloroflexia bacterium]
MMTTAPAAAPPIPTPYRFTADEYDALIRYGLLRPDARLELIEGAIIEMSPIGADHATCVRALIRLLSAFSQEGAILDVQNPIRLSEQAQPQPDVILLQPQPDLYKGRHPRPAEVLLLVEVADSTLAFDRGTKIPLYARAGIREVWLVDLPNQTIEIYTQPTPQGYEQVTAVRRGQTFQSATLAGAAVAANAILL